MLFRSQDCKRVSSRRIGHVIPRVAMLLRSFAVQITLGASWINSHICWLRVHLGFFPSFGLASADGLCRLAFEALAHVFSALGLFHCCGIFSFCHRCNCQAGRIVFGLSSCHTKTLRSASFFLICCLSFPTGRLSPLVFFSFFAAPNLALNLAPFGRWMLRDKAAQHRLALR